MQKVESQELLSTYRLPKLVELNVIHILSKILTFSPKKRLI